MQYRPQSFNLLPPVIKNLLIINGLAFLGALGFGNMFGYDVNGNWGLYLPFVSPEFNPFQIVTHMFLHSTANFSHLFFNMFALWMFGNSLENLWGSKKFLIFYMVTGLGAALCHSLVNYYEYTQVIQNMSPEAIEIVWREGRDVLLSDKNYTDYNMGKLNSLINIPTVGASGAVFGVLMGFGIMYPNVQIYLYFLFPIKAKWFVLGYGILEFISGISQSQSNIAHFAHLGGMLFGYLLIRYWKRNQFRTF
ncbi:MAG: rhomboid family intramembrane serine protease [Schleiferiaceae bacterium]